MKDITTNTPKDINIYDLTGRHIDSPQKGKIYIKDRKKVAF